MDTVGSLIEEVARALAGARVVFGHGTDNPWDEATALVLAVTGLGDDRSNLEEPVAVADARCIRALLERRVTERLPLAHLLGRWWFAGHEFQVADGVMVPRSPIGELIERGFRPWLRSAPQRVLDLCTGTGCIGISVAHAFPEARVDLVELDPRAAACARENVVVHGLEHRVRVFEGDLFQALPDERQSYDLIVANPPYVPAGALAGLPVEYRHEPALGLVAGTDGLDVVRRIVEAAPDWLRSGGLLVCEVGQSAGVLVEAYPELPFIWAELERGGEGVFVLEVA